VPGEATRAGETSPRDVPTSDRKPQMRRGEAANAFADAARATAVAISQLANAEMSDIQA